MPKETYSGKTIAKNTIFLYVRMFLLLAINLFTSRVVLQTLGFSDYGIYNVVGGVVTMLTFLNTGMAGASQRFISYELGKGNLESLKNTFCTSVITHMAIALIVIVIMETIGVWFLNYKLNIPASRMFAANWVFQCSLITFVLSITSVPYNSCIIAHERMSTFAYISIFEAIAKLAIVYALYLISLDKLIVYSTLMAITQGIIRLIYILYCKRHFEECIFHYNIDKKLFKEMFAFAGWSCIGNMGFSTKDQLSNILLNLFFGTTVNAARGIAGQVNSVINSFASNFTMAMNPQIVKLYASGNYEKSRDLAFAGSKYAFFLLTMIAVPFLINENYLLRLWLVQVPRYTDIFVVIIVICSLIYSLTHTISTAIAATGNIKRLQILLAIILLSEIPIAYVILKCGGKPYQAMLPSLFTTFATVIMRICLLKRLMPKYYSISYYLTNTVLRCFVIFGVVAIPSWYLRSLFSESFSNFIITSVISVLIIVIVIYLLGLTSHEKDMVKNKVILFINKKIKNEKTNQN